MRLPTDTQKLIVIAAGRVSLDPLLVEAQVIIESGGDTWAWNPEPRYRYLWNVNTHRPFRALTPAEQIDEVPPRDFPTYAGDRDQEWWGQQASFGLLQIMGAVAREFGFGGRYLTQLLEPELNLSIGTALLARNIARAQSVRGGLAMYNGGPGGMLAAAPQAYADKVLALKATWV